MGEQGGGTGREKPEKRKMIEGGQGERRAGEQGDCPHCQSETWKMLSATTCGHA